MSHPKVGTCLLCSRNIALGHAIHCPLYKRVNMQEVLGTSDEQAELAKKIVDSIDNDKDVDIEAWAERLANDISEGKD